MNKSIFLLLATVVTLAASSSEKLFVCYYTNWSQYRPGEGKFLPENIEANLCTHIVFAFAKVVGESIEPYEWNDPDSQWSLGLYSKTLALRSTNPKLRVLIGLGGWNHGPGAFSDMVHSDQSRQRFVQNAVRFLQKYKFDGLDLDWEYPGSRDGSRPTDKTLFTKLVMELKEAFRPHNFLLTAAVAAGKESIDKAYEIPQLAQSLDFVNLMAYDLHGAWENFTDHNAPLYSRKTEKGNATYLNVDWAVNYWINNGMPREKLILGLATYGRAFKLLDSEQNTPGSPNNGPGTPGTFTREAGFLSYYEICEKLKSGWSRVWSDEQMVPYAHGENEWVGYDDADSLRIKADYIVDKNLGGAMFWAIDLDDFSGRYCNQGRYPLINQVRNRINSAVKLNEKKLFCTYDMSSITRPGVGRFSLLDNFDSNLCTHLVLISGQVLNGMFYVSKEFTTEILEKLTHFKQNNPSVKVIISVNDPIVSLRASNMLTNYAVDKFTQSLVQFLAKYKLDGINILSYYMHSNEQELSRNREMYSNLLKSLRKSFKDERLLTITIPPQPMIFEKIFETDLATSLVDYINLVGSEFLRFTNNQQLHYISPLYEPKSYKFTNSDELNVNSAVENLLANYGVPSRKLVVIVVTHGRSFLLANSANTLPGALNNGIGSKGEFTQRDGFLSYYEICKRTSNEIEWSEVWSKEDNLPYAYSKTEWVSYENINSIKQKAQFIVEKKLAGAMVYSLDLDDFTGLMCYQGKYPLINAIKTEFQVWSNKQLEKKRKQTKEKLFVCYYSNWSQYRPKGGTFLPEDIDPTLCTHIIFAFAVVRDDRIKSFEWNDEGEKGLYARVVALKAKNPALKVLIGVGGWNHGSLPFSNMVHSEVMRRNFVKNCVEFIKEHKFDGLDLDWEYPASRDSNRATDKQLFTQLISELRDAFTPYGWLLTAAVAAGKDNIDRGYEISSIHQKLDFINLMAYDLHGAWENTLDYNAPLYARSGEQGNASYLNIDWAVNYWIKNGLPREKLILGLATYGRAFTLLDANKHTPGSPNNGSGLAGKYTRESGFLSYYEVCDKLGNAGWKRAWSNEQSVPHAYGEMQWVGYDDQQSLRLKSEYVVKNRLGGVMFWAVDLDDFSGEFCNQGKYPLIKTVREAIFENLIDYEEPNESNKASASSESVNKTALVCYYSSSSQHRPGYGKFLPEDIDPKLCSHLIFASARLVGSNIQPNEWNDLDTQWSRGLYSRVLLLKSNKPDLKILIDLSEDPAVSSDATKKLIDAARGDQTIFANSLVEFVKKHQFDGMNLDLKHAIDSTDSNSIKLLQSLIERVSTVFKSNYLLLTATVMPGKESTSKVYSINSLSKNFDFVNLLAFDLNRNSNLAEHSAPVYPRKSEVSSNFLNVDWIVSFWLGNGLLRENLVLGLPTYSRVYQLFDASQYATGSRITGPALAGNVTRTPGVLSAYETCNKLNGGGWVRGWCDEQKVSYAHGSNGEWASYEDLASLKAKVEYVMKKKLKGIMVWSVDMDDFRGESCGQGKYPLLNSIKKELDQLEKNTAHTLTAQNPKSSGPTSTLRQTDKRKYLLNPGLDFVDQFYAYFAKQPAPVVSRLATEKLVVENQDSEFECQTDGWFAVRSTGCQVYYNCVYSGKPFEVKTRFSCPQGTIFNNQLGVCDWINNVKC